jgi:O-antigen/teichoic acid export membrane protein
MLGALGLGFAIATPVILFTNLHLRPVYVVDETGEWEFADYLGVRLASLVVAAIGGALVIAMMGLSPEITSVALAVLLYRVAEGLGDIFIAPAQRRNVLGRYSFSRGARGGLLLAGIVGGHVLGLSVIASIWLGCSLTLVLSVVYDRETARRFATSRPRLSWARMFRLGRWTAPAGIAAGILSLTLGIPAYVLEAAREVREVGFLTAALSIVAIGSMLNVIVGGATIRTLASLYAQGDRAHLRFLARLSGGIALLHGGLIIAVVFAGDIYLSKVFAVDYVHLHRALVWVSITGLIAGLGNIMSQTVMAMRHFKTQLTVNALGVVLVLLVASVLIPAHGVLGAVFVHLTIASYRLVAFVVVLAFPSSVAETGSHQPSASKIQK